MKLSNLQNIFQQYLTQGDQATVKPMIADHNRFNAERGLKVYFDAYRIRLCEILKLDFPKTHTMMGDDHFDEAFVLYLQKYPSKHFSVRYFGQHFAHFLRCEAPYSDYPALAEMAEFEWSVSFTIDASDGPIVDVAAFQVFKPTDWPDLLFTLHPSVTHCLFSFNTPHIWQLIDKEEDPSTPEKQPATLRWLFWRKGMKSYFRSCNSAQDTMLQGVLNGQSFGDLCESLLTLLPENEIPGFVAQTLYQWVQDEMISAICVQQNEA